MRIVRDPGGVLVDVITGIEPSPEYLAAFRREARNGGSPQAPVRRR